MVNQNNTAVDTTSCHTKQTRPTWQHTCKHMHTIETPRHVANKTNLKLLHTCTHAHTTCTVHVHHTCGKPHRGQQARSSHPALAALEGAHRKGGTSPQHSTATAATSNCTHSRIDHRLLSVCHCYCGGCGAARDSSRNTLPTLHML